MSLFPEIMGRRGSLIERALFPNLFGDASPQAGPASTPAPPAAAASTAPARRPGLRDILTTIFTGAADPRLTEEQNSQAANAAMVHGGLTTMAAASQPGASAVGAFAEGAMFGHQDRVAQSEIIYGRTATERIQNALNNPALTAKLTPEQRQLIALMPPAEAMKAISELAFKTPERHVLADGSTMYDNEGNVIATNAPKPGEMPNELRMALWAEGIDPNKATREQQEAVWQRILQLRRSGGSNTNINLPGDTSEGVNKIGLGLLEGFSNDANVARTTIDQLGVMEALLNDGMDTGRLDAVTMNLRGLAVSAGMGSEEMVKNLSRQELFQAHSNRLAILQKTGLVGPMSDRDILFLKEQVPKMSNTPEGNRIMIEVMRRFEQRKMEIADVAEEYVGRTGNAMGLRRHVSDWAKAHPMSLSDLIPAGQITWGGNG